MTEEIKVDALGRDVKTGRFAAGFAKAGPGRPKGSRNNMTKKMLSRVAEAGMSPEDVLIDIYQDTTMPPDLRFKAAAKIADIVYPKASSVEVKMDEKENMSIQQIDDKLKQLMAMAQVG